MTPKPTKVALEITSPAGVEHASNICEAWVRSYELPTPVTVKVVKRA